MFQVQVVFLPVLKVPSDKIEFYINTLVGYTFFIFFLSRDLLPLYAREMTDGSRVTKLKLRTRGQLE